MIRLDKYLAHHSPLSRREAQQAVRKGAVLVNGVIATHADHKLATSDQVCLDGQPLLPRGPVYLMLHKPAGVVSVTRDAHRRTALDLISRTALGIPADHPLQVAGRLDLDATGLLLITDDGDWNHRLTAPAANKRKRYRVKTNSSIDSVCAQQFADGVSLRGETRPTRPAQLTILDSHEALLEITEGRYHQVKRMFAATGNRVTALHREAMGAIELDPTLAPGEYRPLTPEEIASV